MIHGSGAWFGLSEENACPREQKKKRVTWDVRAQTTILQQHQNLLPIS